MADDQTLLLEAAKALNLDGDLAMLKAVEDTVANWAKLKPNIHGIDDVDALLAKLAGDLNQPEIAAAFKAVGLDKTYADLTGFVKKAIAGSNAIPPMYKKLLNPLSSFAAGADGKVQWTLGVGDKPVVKTDQYALDLGATATVGFDAAAAWPGDGAAPAKLLMLGASGEVKAGLTGTIPYTMGSLTLGAGAKATAALGYYFDESASPDELYAAAVARRLGHLPDPFHFGSVWDAFQTSDLAGINVVFGGTANASFQVAFADSETLAGGKIPVDIGLTVGVTSSLTSSYTLNLLKTTTDGNKPAIRAHLSRPKVKESTFNTELKLEVDIAALTGPVVAAMTSAVGKWDGALAAITDYLSPGTWLRTHAGAALTAEITKLVKTPALRDAVLADLKGALGLGPVDDSEIVKWLTNQVTGAIDQGKVLADGKIDQAVVRVMTPLKAALPLLASNDPTSALETLVTDQVNELDAALKAAVGDLLKTPAADIKAAFAKAGAPISGALATLDDALKAVRDLLAKYNTTLHTILDAAAAAAKKKVTARLYLAETRHDETVVEAVGMFTARDDAAETVFKALTGGSLQALVAVIDGQDNTASFTADADASSLTRFSKFHSEQGLEVVFLGIGVTSTTVIDAKTKVVVDGHGNVLVNTDGALTKVLTTPMNTREASFVDAYAVVMAAAVKQKPSAGVPSLSLGVGASYSDKSLSLGEVGDFIQSLADNKLVAPDAKDKAQAALTTLSGPGGGGKIAGSIAGDLKLSGGAIETLLQLTERGPGGLSDAARIKIIQTGLAALQAHGAIRAKDWQDGLERAVGLFNPPAHKDWSIAELILRLYTGIPGLDRPPLDELPDENNTPQVIAGDPSGSGQDNYTYFMRQSFALLKLVELIDTMGAVYQAKPEGDGAGAVDGWKQDKYQKAQETMVKDSGLWLAVADSLVALFTADVSRRTTAFMRAMADLSGRTAPPPGGVVVTLTSTPTGGDPVTVPVG